MTTCPLCNGTKKINISTTVVVDCLSCKVDAVQRPNAKLTREQVLQIRKATGRQDKIAEQYGVSYKTVSAIKRRRTWRDL